MKKPLFMFAFLLIFGSMVSAQTPQKTIELFFKAMHRQDTVAMRSLTYGNLALRSVSNNKTGAAQITSKDFDDFLNTVASLPKEMTFEERIHDFEVKMDGDMAHVWTPYSFFLNGKLSHCGVNSFQLYKENGVWKIISIVDTRRKGCKK